MSTRRELEEEVRQGFRTVMLSNHTAEKYIAESTASELRFLSGLFGEEIGWREHSKKERMLKRAKFPIPKSFENYDWTRIKLPPELNQEDIESCSFVENCQNLILYGGVGNGKTHMAIACGSAACNKGLRVLFTTIADLVVKMQGAAMEGTLEKVFKDIERCDLVILDELGYLPIDQEGARLLYQVVNKCYEQRSLMVTTNLEFSRWGKILTDDQMAAAMIDRIIHYGHLVVFDGPTKRMETSPMTRGRINR